jgi:hypothetical protein
MIIEAPMDITLLAIFLKKILSLYYEVYFVLKNIFTRWKCAL